MDFNKQDIEAIAKDRVMRTEGKKTSYFSWAMIIFVVAGLIVAWRVNNIAGYVVVGVSIILWLWYTNNLAKKQKLAQWKLVKQYNEEKEKISQEGK